jgi:dienelactone hydrolase
MANPFRVRASARSLALPALAWITSSLLGCADVVTYADERVISEPRVGDPAPATTLAETSPVVRADASGIEGTWYLNTTAARLTLQVHGRADGSLHGVLSAEADGHAWPVDRVVWDARHGRMTFHHPLGDSTVWFDARVTDGVLSGRMALSVGVTPPEPAAFRTHVTGWNTAVIDLAPVPRVYDVRWSDGRLGRVRIDRAATGDGLVGSLKVYADVRIGAGAEAEERDLADVRWDGANLSFSLDEAGTVWTYRGVAAGRMIGGEATSDHVGVQPLRWAGTRAEVLAYGLTPRTVAEHERWAARARRQIALLTMAGNPTPTATRVETVAEHLAPIESRRTATTPAPPPQAYTLSELRVERDLADEQGAHIATRESHLFIAWPTTPMPRDGYPVVVAANGHYGSAHALMDPNSSYGYGDAFARRGYVVVAVDVSHRPVSERGGLYTDIPAGDEAATGNGAHPSIHAPGLDSDWEEDGERAWDVMRAADLARGLPQVNPRRMLVTGLSMGGEVATYAGALDERVESVVVAGFAPDLGVIAYRGNHPCWRWNHGDVREYIGVSVLHALVAPRLLVVETGTNDFTFSAFRAPFASDKQVLRRSRAAWGEQSYRLVHFLHDGAHVYRTGDPSLDLTTTRGISLPVRIAPDVSGSAAWQTDAATQLAPMTVFDLTRGAFAR